LAAPNCWLEFDGSNDYAEVADHADLNLAGSDYTIEYWVNTATESHGAWVSKRATGRSGYTLSSHVPQPANASNGCCGGGGGMYFNLTYSGHDYWDDSASLSEGWHHVALTHDTSERTSTLWMDGNILGTSSSFESMGASSQTLWFGREHVNTTEFSQGKLSGVQLSNTILYDEAFTPFWPLSAGSSSVALWTMDEATAASLNSNDGDHNGSIYGATWGGDCSSDVHEEEACGETSTLHSTFTGSSGKKYYYCQDDGINYTDARSACEEDGHYLVSLETEAYQDELMSALPSYADRYWIGLSEGWSFCNGDGIYCWYPWSESYAHSSLGYTNWAPSEPSVARGRAWLETSSGQWFSDGDSPLLEGFICQEPS
jgi:hypothetical protein